MLDVIIERLIFFFMEIYARHSVVIVCIFTIEPPMLILMTFHVTSKSRETVIFGLDLKLSSQ